MPDEAQQTEDAPSVIGNNAATVLLGYIERLERIDEEKEGLQNDRTAYFAELKEKQLPIAGLRHCLKVQGKDEEELKLERLAITQAGQMLGVAVHTRKSDVISLRDFDDENVELFQQRYKAILNINEEITGLTADRKEVLKEAKATGFAPKIIERILKIRKDPEAWHETNALIDTYLHAIEVK